MTLNIVKAISILAVFSLMGCRDFHNDWRCERTDEIRTWVVHYRHNSHSKRVRTEKHRKYVCWGLEVGDK